MARPYVFPDPNDRSPNAPTIIAGKDQVLGLYNQMTDSSAQYVTATVQNWFGETAKKLGWDGVHHSGNQTVLAMDITPKPEYSTGLEQTGITGTTSSE